jgi:hypothetical protein
MAPLLSAALAMKAFRSRALRTSRPAVVETPNTADEIMTKDVVSVFAGRSVRDVAIRLLEKRIRAVPVLAAKLQLLGMVSEGPTTAARKRTPGAWLTSACSPSGKRANRLRVRPRLARGFSCRAIAWVDSEGWRGAPLRLRGTVQYFGCKAAVWRLRLVQTCGVGASSKLPRAAGGPPTPARCLNCRDRG